VKTPPACPRCGSTEVKFVEATPTTLFWQCHGCRHDWASGPDGAVLDAE
jgi:ribosomal protein L37AE/L43A